MNHIAQTLFRAVHEGKWLSIEYRNLNGEQHRYWIAVLQINAEKKTLRVEGFHLTEHTVRVLPHIYIDSILSSAVVEGSYCEINEEQVRDMDENPERYEAIFGSAVNLKILNYLADCSRLDAEPYQCDYCLVRCLDAQTLGRGEYVLSEEQFRQIVAQFQAEAGEAASRGSYKLRQLCMNVMSIPAQKRRGGREALYVLAYRKMYLDVKRRTLKPAEDITVCREFTVDGERQSIRRFLQPEDYALLDAFEQHQEELKDRITAGNPQIAGVDDRPYLIALGLDCKVDLNQEYAAVVSQFESGQAAYPLRAFFGALTARAVRRKDYPITLLEPRANLDQLLAIHNAVKYPVTYVQGPPGTGKSYTIVNTVVTAFFNEKTVLLSSYNNHPVDTVVKSLEAITYGPGGTIPFPVIRLGSDERVEKALERMRALYEMVQSRKVYEKTLERNRGDRAERMGRLTELLKKHEEILSLREQKEAIEVLLRESRQLTFQADLQGRQLAAVNRRLAEIGEVTDEEALSLLSDDGEAFKKYLNFTSIKYLKRLGEPKNEDLRKILEIQNGKEQVAAFNSYISQPENLKKFLRIFPVVATTCISAHKLGTPEPEFDLVIIDEASQCNMAQSLVPILRGENLMLVGDPQQLSPVILLDERDNAVLKRRYLIPEEYDYRKNSIYKAFLANDAVSDEILLRHHYRCNPRIISFNNQKYYNGRLCIDSADGTQPPLLYMEVPGNRTFYRNTAPQEAEKIIEYVKTHREKKIGVITPFSNQKEYIAARLAEEGLEDVTCGTVHAFQGDEKDVILFSLAVTEQTGEKTYGWLKNNRELINVATSRAREQLVVIGSTENLERLHREEERDDVYELVRYVQKNGDCRVTAEEVQSRALGVKPYSTETEEEFLKSLNHALENILNTGKKCTVKKEVAIAQVFQENIAHERLFYSGRFDFVIYEREYGGRELPVMAIELDGREHITDEAVRRRDRRKEEICQKHGFTLIRVENSYARRYYFIKRILEAYFKQIGEL